MSRAWRTVLAGAVALTAGVRSAPAHDTWLLPDLFDTPPGSRIALELTSGMAYPEPETAIQPDRIGRAVLRLAGKTVDIPERASAAKALRLAIALDDPGIATLAVDLEPRTIELTREQVPEYLEEIGSPPAVVEAWNRMPEPKRWRESYVKHAKTFVRVGEPAADDSWAQALGLALEIVPEKDPTGLHAGDSLPVRVLKGGEPFAGFTVELVAAGASADARQTTDTAGRATFRLPRAGRWLLRGTDVRATSRPDADWESDFTTLTLEVR